MSMRTEKEKKKRKKQQRQVVEGKRSSFATGGPVKKKPRELTAEDKAIINRALESTGSGEYEEGTPMDKAQKKKKKVEKRGVTEKMSYPVLGLPRLTPEQERDTLRWYRELDKQDKLKKSLKKGPTTKKTKMGGGMIKKYSKGGKVDGLAIRGRTRGRMVKGRK